MNLTCSNCPFTIGSTFELSMCRERAQEIAESLEGGGMFPCHMTTTAGGAEAGRERWCGGALATMENGGGCYQNQMVRICDRLGGIGDLDKLDLDKAYCSLEEWVDVHEPMEKQGCV